jgi:septum formation protein
MMSVPFVLASASPRRRRLLRSLVPRFSVAVSGVREPAPRRGERPGAFARRLARLKAAAVASTISRGLVLGADTVVVRRGVFYGKPRDRGEARRMLSELAGRRHAVYTGVALAARPGRRLWVDVRRTDVWMRVLSSRVMSRLSRHLDKAGAYAAQARGNPFVKSYRGDFETVVGLPLEAVRVLLARARRAGFKTIFRDPALPRSG